MFFIFLYLFSFCALAERPVVYVYNWADYIPQEVLEKFTEETHIKVVYDVFDNAETLEAKLFLGSGYDVVFPTAWPLFARGLEAEIFMPLNKALVPNMKFLDPALIDKLKDIDPKQQYGVPYLWGTTGIGYDKDKILGVMKDAPLDSWALFFDPKIVARLGDCRPQLLDGATDVFQAALLYLGYSPFTLDRKKWEKAIKVIENVRDFITTFDNSRQIEALSTGQTSLMQGFSTYINMAKDKAPDKALHYVIPKEGAVVWIDMMAIPKTAPHPKNAHKLINFLLRPDIMSLISNTIRANNPVPLSHQHIDKNLLKDDMVFPSADVMKRVYPDVSLPLKLQRWLSRAWLKIKMRRF